MNLDELLFDEELRRREFPVAANRIFMAHAAVTALPRVAVEAMRDFAERGAQDSQENEWVWAKVAAARRAAARLLGCDAREIALLGPTALGLNLVANGFPWKAGDEVIYYRDDYPANVYPWTSLAERGVKAISLAPETPGRITWDLVEAAITSRTRLVALASCSFLSGYRIDVDQIGKNLHERGILFSLDAIQTLGAFPVSTEHVDFLSADSHKWLLGPVGAGIFYVKAAHHDFLKPTLLGSWNVVSPQFIAQDRIAYYEGARRYEPGSLNLPGIVGMHAAMEMILDIGVEAISERLLELRRTFLAKVRPLGYRLYIEDWDSSGAASDGERSCIISLTHPQHDLKAVAQRLREANVSISLRQNRNGDSLLRFSPHFYATRGETERVAAILRDPTP
ncbi:MAG: aminotransferase class V-fold PLP-dependent enzyme [Candidatus Hydrogenedentes bacterium]|nr:aminotransferase class V-fold PLP-dependent enzyme [Candidatus Hydrogenedentota bacterium]